MRYASMRKSRYVLPALAAAGLGAMLGVPAAHGDFIITVTQFAGPISTTGVAGSVGAGDTDYVLSALNNGLNGTGTNLLALDVTIDATHGLIISTQNDVNDDGFDDANINGLPDEGNGLAIPTFGGHYNKTTSGPNDNNPFVGTFVAPAVPISQPASKVPDSLAFADGSFSVVTVQLNANVGTAGTNNYITDSADNFSIDPAFLNGTVSSLRVVGAYTSATNKGQNASVTSIPFANIVLPTGTTGTLAATVFGALAGDQGSAQPFSVTLNFGSATTTTPPAGPFMKLGTTATDTLAAATNLGSISLSGSHGSYAAQTVAVTGAGQTAGFLTVSGFTPGDTQVYGLAVTDANLTSLIAQLNAALGSVDPGAIVEATPANLASVLAGDNVVAIIPTTSAFSPNIFSYDLTNSDPGTITSITVVPEPTGIGALVLGGLGLLSRRKRKTA